MLYFGDVAKKRGGQRSDWFCFMTRSDYNLNCFPASVNGLLLYPSMLIIASTLVMFSFHIISQTYEIGTNSTKFIGLYFFMLYLVIILEVSAFCTCNPLIITPFWPIAIQMLTAPWKWQPLNVFQPLSSRPRRRKLGDGFQERNKPPPPCLQPSKRSAASKAPSIKWHIFTVSLYYSSGPRWVLLSTFVMTTKRTV